MVAAMFATMSLTVSAQSTGGQVAASDTLFYESFDDMTGKGGNDGNWDIAYSLKMWEFSTKGTINDGWTNTLTDVRPANKCIVIGTTGNLQSPVLENLNGAAILTFRAGTTKNYNTRLKITAISDGEFTETGSNVAYVDLPNKEFGTFKLILKGCTAKTRLSFTNPNAFSALLLDDVLLTNMVSVDESKPNILTMTKYNGKTIDVLIGRTLSADKWNSICLPFALTAEQIASTFGEGTEVAAFKSASQKEKRLEFENVSEMEAGKPYLIRTREDVKDPIAEGVTMRMLVNSIVTKGLYSFIGTTTPMAKLTKIIVLNDDMTLGEVEKDETFYRLPALNAYFTLPIGTDAADVTVSINDKPTAIDGVHEATTATGNDNIYNISGQKVKSATSGLYIINGKKVLVK